jgi:ABC transporter ATM
MLRRAARSPCARLAQLTPTASYGAVYLKPQPNTVVDRTQLRIFTTRGGVWREQNDPKSPPPRTPVDRIPQPPKIATSPAPASQKPSETLKPDVKKSNLLSEATITKQEQRKADWAIMKEMAKYLWPKVQWSTCVDRRPLLSWNRTTGAPKCVLEQLLLCLLEQRYVAVDDFAVRC